MLEMISLSGLTAFVVVSFVVGMRILILAARTRLLPETTIGASLFLAGGVGTAMMIAPSIVPSMAADTGFALYHVGSLCSHVGFLLLFVFVWRVFRPGEAWATALFLICAAALMTGGVGMSLETRGEGVRPLREAIDGGVWFWLSMGARFTGYAWAALESFRYYALLKRRLELGLADEAVTMRFFHWGICTSAVVVIWVTAALQNLLSEFEDFVAMSGIVTPLMGFVVAGSLWVAFFPKRRRVDVGDASVVAGGEQAR